MSTYRATVCQQQSCKPLSRQRSETSVQNNLHLSRGRTWGEGGKEGKSWKKIKTEKGRMRRGHARDDNEKRS